jgi:hypothetical protein
MKNMVSVLLVMLWIVPQLSAQVSRTITLSVSDTVLLEPIRIIYLIEAGDKEKFMGMKLPMGDEPEASASLDELLKGLKKEKFNAAWAEVDDFDLNRSTATYKALKVELLNKIELIRLIEFLKTVKGVSGSIHRMDHEPFAKYQDNFFASLIDKARSQAMAIARATDSTLGKIISVTEAPSADGYGQMMEQMMKNPVFKSVYGARSGLSRQYVRTLMVQFAVE